jgi:hypothetical protein
MLQSSEGGRKDKTDYESIFKFETHVNVINLFNPKKKGSIYEKSYLFRVD